MTDLPENAASLVGREFVHFKGGHYRLRGFAKDSETLETMVAYEALYGDSPTLTSYGGTGGGLWVRPAKMFFENDRADQMSRKMKIECEKLSERAATHELIRELVNDGTRRGEYMIMMRDDDDEAFVQIACDFDQVGNENDGCFDLEYREGKDSQLFHCRRRVPAVEVEELFLDELDGRSSWRSRYEWDEIAGYGGHKINLRLPIKRLLLFMAVLFVVAYVGHAAYLWKQYGPPTGFCTKCLIYWGRHKVWGANNRHWVEHSPLRWCWSVFGCDKDESGNGKRAKPK